MKHLFVLSLALLLSGGFSQISFANDSEYSDEDYPMAEDVSSNTEEEEEKEDEESVSEYDYVEE